MDFLNEKVTSIYSKYLLAAFGSAMITSIYSIVDMAMVGQYQGPEGTAALAVVAPVWNIIYSLGLLMGIGGSVIFSTKRGSGEQKNGGENQYFTAALIGAVVLAIVAWICILEFECPILTFFGADESLLVLAQKYMRAIRYVFPLFLFNQMLAAFVVSVARGFVISGLLILLLPILIGASAIWFAMPITELLVMFYAARKIQTYTRSLSENGTGDI